MVIYPKVNVAIAYGTFGCPPVMRRRAAREVAAVLPESDITVTHSVFLPIVLPKQWAGAIYIHAARYPKGQMRLYWRASRIEAPSMDAAQAIRRQL
jgi:hypothetical protein